MIKAVIFDIGDTLVNTHNYFSDKSLKTNQNILRKYGIIASRKQISEAKRKAEVASKKYWLMKNAYPGFFSKLVCKNLNADIDEKTSKNMDIEFVKDFVNTITLKPYSKYILKYLKNKKYRMGLLTSYDRYTLNKILKKFNIEKYFDVIVTIEDTGVGKNTSLPYKTIIKKFNVLSSEAVMIGDNEYDDAIVPSVLGIKPILVNSIQNKNKKYCYVKSLREIRNFL